MRQWWDDASSNGLLQAEGLAQGCETIRRAAKYEEEIPITGQSEGKRDICVRSGQERGTMQLHPDSQMTREEMAGFSRMAESIFLDEEDNADDD